MSETLKLVWEILWQKKRKLAIFCDRHPDPELISRYRELNPDIGNSNSRYREMISRYREFEFRISGNMELFSDIGNSISRYQEIIPDIEK